MLQQFESMGTYIHVSGPSPPPLFLPPTLHTYTHTSSPPPSPSHEPQVRAYREEFALAAAALHRAADLDPALPVQEHLR